jgi:hypothetical protein
MTAKKLRIMSDEARIVVSVFSVGKCVIGD